MFLCTGRPLLIIFIERWKSDDRVEILSHLDIIHVFINDYSQLVLINSARKEYNVCYYILLLGKRNSFYSTWIFLVLILGESPQMIAVSTSRKLKLNEYHYRYIDSFDEVSKNDDSNKR